MLKRIDRIVHIQIELAFVDHDRKLNCYEHRHQLLKLLSNAEQAIAEARQAIEEEAEEGMQITAENVCNDLLDARTRIQRLLETTA